MPLEDLFPGKVIFRYNFQINPNIVSLTEGESGVMVSLEIYSILGTQSTFLDSGKQSQVYLGSFCMPAGQLCIELSQWDLNMYTFHIS